MSTLNHPHRLIRSFRTKGRITSVSVPNSAINFSSSLRIACLQYLAEQAGMAVKLERQAS